MGLTDVLLDHLAGDVPAEAVLGELESAVDFESAVVEAARHHRGALRDLTLAAALGRRVTPCSVSVYLALWDLPGDIGTLIAIQDASGPARWHDAARLSFTWAEDQGTIDVRLASRIPAALLAEGSMMLDAGAGRRRVCDILTALWGRAAVDAVCRRPHVGSVTDALTLESDHAELYEKHPSLWNVGFKSGLTPVGLASVLGAHSSAQLDVADVLAADVLRTRTFAITADGLFGRCVAAAVALA